MGASLVLTSLHEAVKLTKEDRRDGDPTKTDEAIRRRPEDWTYRVSRAALALQQRDPASYAQQTGEAQAIRHARGIDPAWYARRTGSDLEYAESRLRIGGWKSTEQCQRLYFALELEYARLCQLSRGP